MAKKKTQPSKEELRLNKIKEAAICGTCGFHFPGEGIFTCFCKIVHQCKSVGGIITAVPLVVEEGLIRI